MAPELSLGEMKFYLLFTHRIREEEVFNFKHWVLLLLCVYQELVIQDANKKFIQVHILRETSLQT